MILIVDSGSTKTDWIALDNNGNELFSTQTLGLNPQMLSNEILNERIKNNFDKIDIDLIDKYEINGDYIESQAFAFLAIRSVEGLPISFPSTTRCNEASTGGISVENF